MIPFRLVFQSGIPVHEQVFFAAKRAIISGKLRPGDAFPSVRALSKAMKIHANTAQKVIAQLTLEGLLEVRPGIGTVVVSRPPSSRAERSRILSRDIEHLTVEAMGVGMALEELQDAIAERWRRIQPLVATS